MGYFDILKNNEINNESKLNEFIKENNIEIPVNTNGNGELDGDEAKNLGATIFKMADTNKDGDVSKEEQKAIEEEYQTFFDKPLEVTEEALMNVIKVKAVAEHLEKNKDVPTRFNNMTVDSLEKELLK